MKPELENIFSEGKSLTAYKFAVDAFEFKWHFHPEYELTYIAEGSGFRLVGDHSEPFTAGDLVLIGSNVPHTWVSDSGSSQNQAFVIQFPERTAAFPDFPEWQKVTAMLAESSRGLSFRVNEVLKKQLEELVQAKGIVQLTLLWRILDSLSRQQAQFLASLGYRPNFTTRAASRLDKAFAYIHQRAFTSITLEQVASEVSMTPSSFSRFFKKMSGKTFVHYVNEFRVRKVCQLLIETSDAMPDIAFSTGFGSITHFNRVFLQITNQTPLSYRQQFQK